MEAKLVLSFLSSYLIGSIPFTQILAKWVKGIDLRRVGSHNVGGRNLSRQLGLLWGILGSVLDIAKGAAAMWFAELLGVPDPIRLVNGMAVVAGHNWPVYLQLRGGRGAATGTGVLLALVPWAAAPLSLLSLVVLFLTKSTVKALACLFVPLAFIAWLLDYSPSLVLFSIGLPVLVGISHYLSIRRKPMPTAPTYTRPA